MKNNSTKISVLVFIVCIAFSCRKDKVYESTNAKDKKNHRTFAVGKFNKLVKSSDMDAKYTAAKKYFENEDYGKALTLFEELMSVYRGTEKGEEVQYYYAYCNYNLEDYYIAGYQFRTFAKNYPNSKHAEECAYMNANCFYLNSSTYSLDQTDTKLAIKEFQRFINEYPKSSRLAMCNDILDRMRGKLERKSYENAMLHYDMNDFKSAIVSFGNHMKDFPDTRHLEQLNYLTIKSWYLLALNSIESKKEERFKSATDAYIKYIDLFPKGEFVKDAELVYASAIKALEKYNKNL